MVSKLSLRATVAEMEVGEVVRVPLKLRRYSTIRNTAALLGQELGRKYSVKVDRVADLCKITREN